MYDKLLVPIDGSEHSAETVRQATELASKLGAEITLFHVAPNLPTAVEGTKHAELFLNEVLRNGETILKEEKKKLAGYGLKVSLDMVVGHPAEEICAKAKEGNYDLIVIGSKGLSRNRGFVMGSVSKRVVRHAHCPVLIVR